MGYLDLGEPLRILAHSTRPMLGTWPSLTRQGELSDY
jgi:hypothetical protein